jgi:hypothetical protein
MGALDRYVGRNNRLNLSPSNILEKYLYLFAISVWRNKCVLSRAKTYFLEQGLDLINNFKNNKWEKTESSVYSTAHEYDKE